MNQLIKRRGFNYTERGVSLGRFDGAFAGQRISVVDCKSQVSIRRRERDMNRDAESQHGRAKGEQAGAVISTHTAGSYADQSSTPSEHVRASEGRRLAGLRILTAEDEADARDFVSILLSSHGASVTAVDNGLEAWHTLVSAEQPFHILLSDLSMPEMDGLTLMSNVRQCELPQVQCISAFALTAFAFSSDRAGALKAGFNFFVPKPIDLEELVTLIELACCAQRH